MVKSVHAFLLLLCVSISLAAPPAKLATDLDRVIAGARQSKELSGAKIGVDVQSLSDGSTWYARSAEEDFVPASTTKVITTALILEHLPLDYRYTTRLLANGTVVDGTLHGDLILQGGGDPLLRSDHLRALACQLSEGDAARNVPAIHTITGRLLLNESFFPVRGPLLGDGWAKGDLSHDYAAPASALTCNNNALSVTVRGTKAGKAAEVTLSPKTSLYTIQHGVVTKSGLKTGAMTVISDGFRLKVSGQVAPGATITERISIKDPAAFIAEQMTTALADAKIQLLRKASSSESEHQSVLAEHYSRPLYEIIAVMLKRSDNQIAEQLRWTLLATQMQETLLNRRYVALLMNHAACIGDSGRGLALVDGSGLSRKNLLAPASIVRVLSYIAGREYFRPFYDALPIAGVDGTLKSRMQGTPAAANVHAKTGTMRGVSGLAGYVTSGGGERLAFAVFVNGHSGSTGARNLQNRICTYLAGVR